MWYKYYDHKVSFVADINFVEHRISHGWISTLIGMITARNNKRQKQLTLTFK
jgi:hypothetical protein